jgi:gamma-glutamylaminecyclotransferase
MTANHAHLVAVYGTLKRGECNHRLLAASRCLGPVLLSRLRLYNLGPYPMAVACADPAATVAAELYAVSAAVLAALDGLEDHPREYERQLWLLEDGRQAWVYLGRAAQVRGYPLLADGLWRGGS